MESGEGGSVWRSGAVAPANTLGADGDYYLNIVDGNIYRKDGGVYLLTLNITGQRADTDHG